MTQYADKSKKYRRKFMYTENKTIELNTESAPQVFMKSIAFNDNTWLPLTSNSIIVFTGANNSGKSQVLRDVENSLDKSKENLNIRENNKGRKQ